MTMTPKIWKCIECPDECILVSENDSPKDCPYGQDDPDWREFKEQK